MFKIGDFSKLAQVSVRMLRHYDKLGLLKPSHTDAWTGYRYYTIDQLARLNRIVALNGLGLTLQQITELLDTDDLPVERLRGMLVLRQAEIEHELQDKQAQLAGVAARLQQIEQEGKPSPYEVVVKSVPPMPIAALRQVVPSIAEMGYYCRTMYTQLYDTLRQHDIAPLEPEITLYHTDEYREVDLDVETGVAVAPSVLRETPNSDFLVVHELPAADLTAAVIYEGTYIGIVPAVLALLTWIGTHSYTINGPLRELHLSGPAHVNGVLQEPAVLELQVPIVKLDMPATQAA